MNQEPTAAEIRALQRKLARETASRKQAEILLEQKSLELYESSQKLELVVAQLEESSAQNLIKLEFQQQVDALLIYFGKTFLNQQLDDVLLAKYVGRIKECAVIAHCSLTLLSDLNLGLKKNKFGCERTNTNEATKPSWNENTYSIPLVVNRKRIGVLSADIEPIEQDLEFIEKPLQLIADLLCGAVNRQHIILRNIESRKRAEESERATRDFLAMINHELRTPLNGLLGSSELLQMTQLNNHQQELVSNLSQSGEFLRVIINDLLDFSKISANMFTLLPRKFKLEALITTLKGIFETRAQEKSLQFEIKTEADFPASVEGDLERITQIFVNLIGNAIKFTDQGSVTLTLKWQAQKLAFQVEDTGIGISDEAQEKLFQPFIQAHDSSERNHEGTGLGLAICQQLVSLMGGDIKLESEPGKGTTFGGFIPLPDVKAEDAPELLPNNTNQAQEFAHLSVLVVDDIKMNQIIIKEMLSKLSIKPDITNNGIEALEAAKSKEYDIILMDCRMPEMDGFEATTKLRERAFKKPIIALTASTTKTERALCFDSGMDDVLTKPYRAADLLHLLTKWCHP
ncbi:sensor/response regulator hybrid [Vibrio sp. JCM 19236]|nr:sensor/response regulator hybrid [Vibrio sp. JCM 19236]